MRWEGALEPCIKAIGEITPDGSTRTKFPCGSRRMLTTQTERVACERESSSRNPSYVFQCAFVWGGDRPRAREPRARARPCVCVVTLHRDITVMAAMYLVLLAASASESMRVPTPLSRRMAAPVAQLPMPAFSVVPLNPNPMALSMNSFGECIQNGDQVVLVPGVANAAECDALVKAGVAACDRVGHHPSGATASGCQRSSRGTQLSWQRRSCCVSSTRSMRRCRRSTRRCFRPGDEWASRQPLNAQGQQPSIPPPEYLEETCPTLRDLYMAGELEWSEGEPAINVYTASGSFGCHKDHLALTVLLPLTSADDFTGGGTGFWAGGRSVDEDPFEAPAAVLQARAGHGARLRRRRHTRGNARRSRSAGRPRRELQHPHRRIGGGPLFRPAVLG